MMQMDETDVKILGKLLSDARLSYRRIADEIGVSPPTVLARVKKLENDNVIKCYSAMLDHEKLGYDLTAIIEVTSVKGKIADVEKHIVKFLNVCRLYEITGLTDMIVAVIFIVRAHLSYRVLTELPLQYVCRTTTHV